MGESRQLKRIKRRRERLDRYMLKHGCVDCGYNDNVHALQWDHRDPELKYKSVSSMYSYNLVTLFIEVRKCDIRCSNCHSIRTVRERYGYGTNRKEKT